MSWLILLVQSSVLYSQTVEAKGKRKKEKSREVCRVSHGLKTRFEFCVCFVKRNVKEQCPDTGEYVTSTAMPNVEKSLVIVAIRYLGQIRLGEVYERDLYVAHGTLGEELQAEALRQGGRGCLIGQFGANELGLHRLQLQAIGIVRVHIVEDLIESQITKIQLRLALLYTISIPIESRIDGLQI